MEPVAHRFCKILQDQQASRRSPVISGWDDRDVPLGLTFYAGVGIQTQVFMLEQQAVCWLEPSAQSPAFVFMRNGLL